MRGLTTVLFLVISNIFMTFAWYAHLRFKDFAWGRNLGLVAIILISWGMALFEYMFQVPANRIGFTGNGGPFSLVELKTIQETVTLTVFTLFTFTFFRNERISWNHFVGFALIILAVFFIFKKWR